MKTNSLHLEQFSKLLDLDRVKAHVDRSKDSRYYKKICSRIVDQISETIGCPICGKKNRQRDVVAKIYGLEYIHCTECQHVYIDRLPPWKEYVAISDEVATHMSRSLYEDKSINTYRIEHIAQPKVDYILGHYGEDPNGYWCDIGCGTGEVLVCAQKRGWDVLGVDNNMSSRTFAKDVYELDVVNHQSLNADILQNVGILTLFNVIEHVRDPYRFLKPLVDQLSDEASIIIEVPRYDSFASIAQRSFPKYINRHLIPCAHFQLFTLESLDYLFDRLNLHIESRWWFGQDFYELLQLMSQNNRQFKESAVFQTLVKSCNDFQRVIDQHRLSDGVLTILRKKNDV